MKINEDLQTLDKAYRSNIINNFKTKNNKKSNINIQDNE